MSRKIPAAIGTRGVGGAAAQAVEVEDREDSEDHEAGDGVDDVLVGDRGEDHDDPEHDQAEQRPEERAGPRAEVSAGGVAVRAVGGDERRGGAGRLPQSGRVGAGVVGDGGGDREAEHEAEPEQQPDRELLAAPGGGDVESEDERDRGDEQHEPSHAAQVAAEVGAELGEADGARRRSP